jgi:hypothetical protein
MMHGIEIVNDSLLKAENNNEKNNNKYIIFVLFFIEVIYNEIENIKNPIVSEGPNFQ